jgi:hypothetical protein
VGTITYTWDADGKMTSLTPNGGAGTPITGITDDALGRIVEYDVGGTYTQFVYDGLGDKLARMSGQTLGAARVPLAGGAVARYMPPGPTHSG